MIAPIMRRIACLTACSLLLTACPSDPEGWGPAFDASETGWLLSVWGPSGDDLYAVGGTPDKAAVMHFDGSTWDPVDLGLEAPLLNWTYGFSSSDITTVGADGTILHYDGSAWTAQTTTTTEDLWGVWGAAPDDLWAVGGRGRAEGQQTILHYDGQSWTKIKTPALTRPNVFAFFKVWGSAADDVYVVGQRGAVLHYDGQAWTEQLVGTSEDLVSVWGTSKDNVVIVGGRNNGQIALWNGTTWQQKSLAPLGGLNGVWLRNNAVAHVVGTDGTLATVDLSTLEYVDQTPLEVKPVLDFHAVFGDSQDRLTAVGGSFRLIDGPYEGVAYSKELLEAD